MDTTEKVKSRWTRSYFTALNTRADEERYICDTCQKDFESPSNLALHSQVHVIERRFKCEPCQVSFHSQGHLQKHERSSAHETRVVMTKAFGIPTPDNPRPYGCQECNIAFRKHGHLAKHLRSKSHITRLESLGLIPTGTYVGLEKGSQDIKDKLITTNCEQSLRSLREIASIIAQQPPVLNDRQGPPSESSSLSPDRPPSVPSTSNSAQRTALGGQSLESNLQPFDLHHSHSNQQPLTNLPQPPSAIISNISKIPAPAHIAQGHPMHSAQLPLGMSLTDEQTSQMMMLSQMMSHRIRTQSLNQCP